MQLAREKPAWRNARHSTGERLVAPGADRLARLVLDEAARSLLFRKLVTAALAGAWRPEAVAAIVDRHLAGLDPSDPAHVSRTRAMSPYSPTAPRELPGRHPPFPLNGGRRGATSVLC